METREKFSSRLGFILVLQAVQLVWEMYGDSRISQECTEEEHLCSVSVLSFDFRTSDHCYGVRGWPWKPEEYCKVFQ